MKKIYINPNRCRGCRLCRKGCPTSAIQVRNHIANIGSQCILCEKCISNCPFHAASLWEGNQEEWQQLTTTIKGNNEARCKPDE